MPQVRMPDGVVVAFPDDMPREEIRALIAQKFPQVAPEVDEQPETDTLGERAFLGENSGRAGRLAAQGAGRGLLDLAFALNDAPALAVNLGSQLGTSLGNRVFGNNVGAPSLPLPSDNAANTISALAGRLGVETVEPEGLAENILYNAARFGVQGGTGAGLLARGVRGTQPGVGLAEAFLRPFRNNPGRVIATDTSAGAGAGTGAAVSEEAFPDNPIAGILLSLAGGVGGAGLHTAVRSPASAAEIFLNRLPERNAVTGQTVVDTTTPSLPVPVSRSTANRAARFVQQEASDPAAAARNIENEAAAARAEGRTVPTSGIASDDVGLIGIEQNARQGARRREFIENDQALRGDAVRSVKSVEPVDADARAATDLVQRQVEAERSAARREVDRASGQRESVERARRQEADLVAQARGPGAREAAQQGVDETIVRDTLIPMQERNAQMFARADPARQGVVDSDPLVEAAGAVRGTLGDFNTPSKVIPEGLLRRIERTAGGEVETGVLDASGNPIVRQEPSQTTVGDIVEVFPEMARTEQRARDAQNFTLADNIRTLRQQMWAVLEDAAQRGDEAASRALAARDNYRETLGETFNPGPGDEAAKFRRDFNRDRQNRTTTPPSETAGRFLRPGKPERAESLRRIVDASENPEAGRRAARDFLMNDMAESGVLDSTGVIRPDALRAWRDKKWGAALDSVPDFRDNVNDMLRRAQRGERLSDDLSRQLKRATENLSEIERNRGATRLLLDTEPTKAVGRVFGSNDPERAMSEIMTKLGANSAAVKGWKKAVSEWLADKVQTTATHATDTGEGALSLAAVTKLMRKHEKTLAKVFDKDEMALLHRAQRMLEPLNRRTMNALAGSPTTERREALARGIEAALKAPAPVGFGVLKGGGVFRAIKLAAPNLFGGKTDEAVVRLINQMMFDPELAQHLLTRPVKEIGTPNWTKKLNQIISIAEGGRIAGADDDNE